MVLTLICLCETLIAWTCSKNIWFVPVLLVVCLRGLRRFRRGD